MNHKRKNGYHDGKYYINDTEIELSQEVKEVFEEARKTEERLLRQERRYGVHSSSHYLPKNELTKGTPKDDFIERIEDKSENTEDTILEKEKAGQVRDSMENLSKDELTLLKLLIEKELTEREIGRILGISQVAVNRRKHKIFDKLRKILNDLLMLSL